jgi:glutamate-ammonia-ligase adenylyltransferase
MTAGSDLDLMTIYEAAPDAMSEKKGWGAELLYTRFTQRLITALSAQTAEGGLYEVDMRLRPSGAAGPVAVRLQAFETYYAGEAETWEHMVLTRARVAWATSPAFAERVTAAILTALRRPRDPDATARDVAEMRVLVAQEKPAKGMWDLKLTPGGLVDVEFASQHLQLVNAPNGGPIQVGTLDELRALEAAGLVSPALARPLVEAISLQQSLSQLLKLALSEAVDPSGEPARFKALLAQAGGAKDFAALSARLKKVQAAAHEAFLRVVATENAGASRSRSTEGRRRPGR